MASTTASRDQATFPEDWHANLPPGPAFTLDAMHHPFPVSLLEGRTRSEARAVALHEYLVPVIAIEQVRRNHYVFMRTRLVEAADEADAARLSAPADQALMAEVGRLRERWEYEHRPALVAATDEISQLDPPLPALPDALATVESLRTRIWTIHFRIVTPMLFAMQLFDELYADLFDAPESEAHTLLASIPSESTKAAIGLSDLARKVKANGLEPHFLDGPVSGLRTRLATMEGGDAVLAGLDAWLAEFGYRQDLGDLLDPTWLENPAPAFAAMRGYLSSDRNLRQDLEAARRAAGEALATTRERLAGYPAPVHERFEFLLDAARFAHFLQDEHNSYIDQRAESHFRLFYLRAGRTLADAGLVELADDVLYLTREELGSLAAGQDDAALAARLRQRIATRRIEIDAAKRLTPPPFLGGTPPSRPPYDTALTRGQARFFGPRIPPTGTHSDVRGTAGSRGLATGVARIAHTLEEAGSLLPGEILVAITTMPSWTPLFAIAAAVVTETGGPLSHCAIVAREYGIPAVVGAAAATAVIRTGQVVTVDGTSGVVTIDG